MPYVRKRGVSDYARTGDWSWLWYPPPYRFMSRAQAPPSRYYPTYASARYMGLGCAGQNCSCKGKSMGCDVGWTCCSDSGVDLSLTSTSLADKVQSVLPISSHFQIPNWVLYLGAGLLIFGGGRVSRRRK
jgi:hypothetical protein